MKKKTQRDLPKSVFGKIFMGDKHFLLLKDFLLAKKIFAKKRLGKNWQRIGGSISVRYGEYFLYRHDTEGMR